MRLIALPNPSHTASHYIVLEAIVAITPERYSPARAAGVESNPPIPERDFARIHTDGVSVTVGLTVEEVVKRIRDELGKDG